MDPIDRIDIRGDSTFALLIEAQNRSYEIFYYLPQNLTLQNNRLFARGETLCVRDEVGNHYSLTNPKTLDLATQDVVLLRQDPPFDMSYITSTYLLEHLPPSTLIVNNPKEVRNAPEKIWVLDFLDLMPPTMIARNKEDVEEFRRLHKDIILKPLYGNGGSSVFRVGPDDKNLGSLTELFQTVFREHFMVQKFVPEIEKGDKRIILIDGEIAGAINRLPAKGEIRSNLHVGGTAHPTQLTKREIDICQRLGPELKRRGLLFAGIDVIGEFLTEINVTSPTGIRQIKEFGGTDVACLFWQKVEDKVTALREG